MWAITGARGRGQGSLDCSLLCTCWTISTAKSQNPLKHKKPTEDRLSDLSVSPKGLGKLVGKLLA